MDFCQELQRTKLEFGLAIETAKVDDRSSLGHSSSSDQDGFQEKATTTNLLAMDKTVAVARLACHQVATKSIDFGVLVALQELQIEGLWPDFLEEIEVYFVAASMQVVRYDHPTYQQEQKLQEFVRIVDKVEVFIDFIGFQYFSFHPIGIKI